MNWYFSSCVANQDYHKTRHVTTFFFLFFREGVVKENDYCVNDLCNLSQIAWSYCEVCAQALPGK